MYPEFTITNTAPSQASQAPLDTPVVASPSGTGNLTLTSSSGYNTLLTFTPPDTVTNATNATVLVGGHNVVCVSERPGPGLFPVPYLYSLPSGSSVPVNDVHVFFADNSNKSAIVTGSSYDITVTNIGGVPYLQSSGGTGFPNNVHVFYANQAGYAGYTPILNGGGHSVYVVNVGVPELRCNTGAQYPGYPGNNIHVFYALFAGDIWPSDDRIKWNETLLDKDRSTNIIKDIKFYQYDILKRPLRDTYDTYDPSKCRKGFGVIAQEVEALKVKYPELSDVVENTTVNGDVKAVRYHNLFSIMGAAIQNLIKSVETLEAKVKTLESK